MSSVPEDPETEAIALIEKLRPAPQRDPEAAANGKSKFLAEARAYEASVSAAREQRHMGWKENAMHLTRVPEFLLVIVLIGVAAVAILMVPGPIVGNMFSTINKSLAAVGGPYQTAPAHKPGNAFGATRSAATPQPGGAAGVPVAPSAGYTGQMVIKNANIRLLVKDTHQALDGVTQIVGDVSGYVISSQVHYQNYYGANYEYATLTIGVPVDQFEQALRRLRSLALRVLDENASGQDVTNQYVDLQSQLTNLEATRDRIRSFLDQATSVDEALRVNQQLSEVEGQIEQIKGQMNYLSSRSAFSTITINLEPELPTIVATQTPTPTATPTPSLGAWNAAETTRQATFTLVSAYRLIADSLIWFFLVIVPVFGPPAVLIWLLVWLIRRRSRAAGKGQGAPGLPTNR